MQTVDRLKQKYIANHIDIKTLLADYFPHISSEEYFIKQVKCGQIKLKLSRLTNSRKAPYIVYLTDLANYLDQCELIAQNA